MSKKVEKETSLRGLFPGYIKPDEKEVGRIWQRALIVLDANVLLNLYRYSEVTRSAFLNLLSNNKDRLWVPHQACLEFLRNRVEVIIEQEKSYKSAISELDGIKKKFESERSHPFLTRKLSGKLKTLFDEVSSHLDAEAKKYSDLISTDPILDRLEGILDSRIGESFSEEEKGEVSKEGESRYKNQIPPGYKDSVKGVDGDPFRPYGDLIMWKQIIKKAKGVSRDVIFVSDDQKEDWWLIRSGNTLGPRPELVSEFSKETGNRFLLYKPHRFLAQANKNLDGNLDESVIQETRTQRIDLDPRLLSQTRKAISGDVRLLEVELTKCEKIIFESEREMEKIVDEGGQNHGLARARINRISERMALYKKRHSDLLKLLASITKEKLDYDDELIATIGRDP